MFSIYTYSNYSVLKTLFCYYTANENVDSDNGGTTAVIVIIVIILILVIIAIAVIISLVYWKYHAKEGDDDEKGVYDKNLMN